MDLSIESLRRQVHKEKDKAKFGGNIPFGGGMGGGMGGPLSRSSPSTRSITSSSTLGSSSPAVTPAGAFGGRGTPATFGSLSFGSTTVGSTSPLPSTATATATPIPDRKKVSMSVQGYRSPGFGNAPVGGYGVSGDPPPGHCVDISPSR